MHIRRIVNQIWQWLGEDRRLWTVLAVLLVAQLPPLLLPQAPMSPSQRATFARWLAEQRPELGQWTDILARTGLLSFRSSLWMRALVAGVALFTAARVARWIVGRADFSRRRRWLHGLSCLGGALIVLGWGAQMLWGWSEPGIVAWPGQPVALPDHQRVLPVREGIGRMGGGYGLYLIPQGRSVGLDIQATDAEGAQLALQPSASGEPQAALDVALTEREPERFFALPAEELIIRLSLAPASDPAEVLVEAYRSASGAFITRSMLDDASELRLNGARLHVTRYELPNFEAVYNPGAPLTAAGMLLLGVSAATLSRGPAETEAASDPDEAGADSGAIEDDSAEDTA